MAQMNPWTLGTCAHLKGHMWHCSFVENWFRRGNILQLGEEMENPLRADMEKSPGHTVKKNHDYSKLLIK